jgi:hypothetical protein
VWHPLVVVKVEDKDEENIEGYYWKEVNGPCFLPVLLRWGLLYSGRSCGWCGYAVYLFFIDLIPLAISLHHVWFLKCGLTHTGRDLWWTGVALGYSFIGFILGD